MSEQKQVENNKAKVKRGEGEKIAAAAEDEVKAERKIEKCQHHNNKIMGMMQQSHQREGETLLLILQSEIMNIENKANTETVSKSALEK